MKKKDTVTLLLIGYLAVIVALMLSRNISVTPDRLFIFLLFGAVIIGRAKSFIKEWIPFLALLLGYEMLRGFADNQFSVHVTELIKVERFVFFGYLPGQILQNLFYTPGKIGFHDIAATIIYFLHFPLPLIFAFYLWIKNKSHYYRFVIALVVLSFAGFITFLFFPAAPPWYAANQGLISITKITNLAVDYLGWTWNLSYYYSKLNPNPVAAMPSLHAAYPTLVLLALRSYSRKRFWFFLPYPLLVWLSTVYLGEHYVIDAAAGIIYAVGAFYLVYKWEKVKTFLFPKLNSGYNLIRRLI